MTLIYAHRGNVTAPPSAPANTLAAFAAARRAGADGVELDVRLTCDGAPVIHHDAHLPDARAVQNVRQADLPPSVPSLDAALSACRGISVNIEIKHDPDDGDAHDRPIARAAASALAALSGAGALGEPEGSSAPAAPAAPGAPAAPAVLVSSFDGESLRVVRSMCPAIPLGLLVDWRTANDAALEWAISLGCASLHPFVTQVDEVLAAAASAAGIGLHVWTVNADADIAAMVKLGVTAIITDRVEAAVSILRPMPSGPRA